MTIPNSIRAARIINIRKLAGALALRTMTLAECCVAAGASSAATRYYLRDLADFGLLHVTVKTNRFRTESLQYRLTDAAQRLDELFAMLSLRQRRPVPAAVGARPRRVTTSFVCTDPMALPRGFFGPAREVHA